MIQNLEIVMVSITLVARCHLKLNYLIEIDASPIKVHYKKIIEFKIEQANGVNFVGFFFLGERHNQPDIKLKNLSQLLSISVAESGWQRLIAY